MDSEVLRWFQEVADGVTVTEVADLAMVSQPAVSRALARLEQEVGTELLHRSGRGLRPTQAGATFKRHVDAAMHELDDGLAAVHQLLDPEHGSVTLSFQLSLGTWLVPHVVRRFRESHPQVRFRLLQAQDLLGSSLVARGRVDLELTSRRPVEPDVRWQPLFAETLFLAVPPGHRLAQLEEVPLADAADQDFVMLRPEWQLRTLSDRLCQAAGFSPQVVFESDDLSTVQGFVAAGLGVAILPAMDANPAAPQPGAPWLVRLTDAGASRDVGLAWSPSRRLLPAAELFRRFVLEQRFPTH
jgi:LysR family transcriptional regulator, transcription activator of glutamate synthase operon